MSKNTSRRRFRRRSSEILSEMLKPGEVYENPATGERAVIRIGTDTTGDERQIDVGRGQALCIPRGAITALITMEAGT